MQLFGNFRAILDQTAPYTLAGVSLPPQPKDRRDLDRTDRAAGSIPALGAIAAEPLYNLADTAIVGHLGCGAA